jgi:hypothetical protein
MATIATAATIATIATTTSACWVISWCGCITILLLTDRSSVGPQSVSLVFFSLRICETSHNHLLTFFSFLCSSYAASSTSHKSLTRGHWGYIGLRDNMGRK